MAIHNDVEFKVALEALPVNRRRVAAARFAENVLALSGDARLKAALAAARRDDVSDAELGAALQAAQAASVDSYTQCGHECDWNKQAGHFVAEAALASIKADKGANAAWEAAMHARMARTCEAISAGRGTDNAEPGAQYRILEDFLNS